MKPEATKIYFYISALAWKLTSVTAPVSAAAAAATTTTTDP